MNEDIELLRREIVGLLTGRNFSSTIAVYDCQPNKEKVLLYESRCNGSLLSEDLEIDIIYTREQAEGHEPVTSEKEYSNFIDRVND